MHPECRPRVGDSCGLTPDHLKACLMQMIKASEKNSVSFWQRAFLVGFTYWRTRARNRESASFLVVGAEKQRAGNKRG